MNAIQAWTPVLGRAEAVGVAGGETAFAGVRVAVVARNAQSFIRYVRRPSGSMPAYSEKMLSDQELTDMLAYLRSLPPAKPVGDIPLLNQLRGK